MPTPPPPPPPSPYGSPPSHYGAQQAPPPAPYGSVSNQYGGHNPYNAPAVVVEQGPGSYAERLHSFGRSGTFLIGVILFAAGSVFSLFINFSLFNIIDLILLALPIIAGFLIFAASNSPRLPEKTLPALTLYKVSTIIGLVLFCIAMGALIIGMFFLSGALAIASDFVGLDMNIGAIFILITLVVIAFFVAYLILYYVSALRIINGIRVGLMTNTFSPLRGVMPLMVIVIIAAAFSIISYMITIGMSSLINEIFDEIIREIRWGGLGNDFAVLVESFLPRMDVGMLVIQMLLSAAASVGIIMCLAVVSKFSNSMAFGGGSYHSPKPPVQQSPYSQW